MHFTCLVVGNDCDKQLAPFQLNNEGKCDKEFLTQWVPVVYDPTREYPDDFPASEINEYGVQGYWENPNGKWDNYTVGGRWEDFWPTYSVKHNNFDLWEVINNTAAVAIYGRPIYTSRCVKDYIDFIGMKHAAFVRACSDWESCTQTAPYHHRHHEMNNLRQAKADGATSMQQYAEIMRDNCGITDAFLLNDLWYEDDEESPETYSTSNFHTYSLEWQAKWSALWEMVPNDSVVSIIDCHI